jgi:hypothetical protein
MCVQDRILAALAAAFDDDDIDDVEYVPEADEAEGR